MKNILNSPVLYSRADYLGNTDCPVRVQFQRQRLSRPHYHDFHELVVVAGGCGEHWMPEGHYPIGAGDVFVLKPDMAHCYRSMVKLELVNLLFDRQVLEDNSLDLCEIPGYFTLFDTEPEFRGRNGFRGKLTLDAAQLAVVRDLLLRMDHEARRKQPGYRISMLTMFRQLVIEVTRGYGQPARKSTRRMLQLSLMTRFIEEHLRDDISREEILAAGGVSVGVGTRIFQDLLHESPVTYLRQMRMTLAVELLRAGNLPVYEIARRCGFRDSNYFSLQFKRFSGKSPREFSRLVSG